MPVKPFDDAYLSPLQRSDRVAIVTFWGYTPEPINPHLKRKWAKLTDDTSNADRCIA